MLTLTKYMRRLMFSALALVMLTSAGCGFHLQGSYSIPPQLRTLSLITPDQYSELSRLVQDRLRLHNISVKPVSAKLPRLTLMKDSLERSTLSIYPTGNVAEYELIYRVFFSIAMPDKEAQSFTAEVRRDYLDDPRTALAKSREMDLLVKEMRVQAADYIIQTLAATEVK
ncbi:LPS assembly lipoprotein LptE [Shewanella fodinae]|uniref:LPS-assembly lipoprotein LptE n=1 Tax=Shewanella fodinae TaxID=552357 RepID=UPI00198CBECC|nr:LPS assembly lipoprotein LptE [Shewanella fodinae]MCL2907163.1 LPS assembly lipoprotein LptE [Shewanella fodinae]GGZ06712.1 LPS-assembly lipoprotein LptE [Shewanella fodinae]